MQNLQRIGTVEMEEGLYKLKMSPIKPEYNPDSICPIISSVSAFSCNKTPIDLWHFRLGHLFFERMLLSKESYPKLTVDKEFVSETCRQSKQKKMPFPSSDFHSFCAFALIHVDI